MDFILATTIFLLLTACTPVFVRLLKDKAGLVLSAGPFLFLAILLRHADSILHGHPLRFSLPWIEQLGISFSFYVDAFSFVFASLVSLIGGLIIIYTGGYNKGYHYTVRFYVLMLLFMASMLGVVLADNLFLLFIFWELTSITSYLIIGINHEDEKNAKSALQALVVTAGGGLLMLMGIVMIGNMAGTLELSVLLQEHINLAGHALYAPALILILLGCFTKSAQFPFHFWLPNAMAAPTPASAFLHSATMVKAGVFLMFRLSPVLGGTTLWHGTLFFAGMITMLLGAVTALAKPDMKQVLAYTTISALGTITMMIGVGHEAGILAAIVFLLAHAFYKGALFLLTGIVDHEAGTRELSKLGGLGRRMPVTAAVMILAGLSLGGVMPTFSFIAKELILENAVHEGMFSAWLLPAIVVTGACFMAVALHLFFTPFTGELKHAEGAHVHEAPWIMWCAPGVMAVSGLAGGLSGGWLAHHLIEPVVSSIINHEAHHVHLHLWAGLKPAFLFSMAALAAGVMLFLLRGVYQRCVNSCLHILRVGAEDGYNLFMSSIYAVAKWQTRIIQTGYLRHYLLVTMIFSILLLSWALLHAEVFSWIDLSWDTVYWHEYGIAAVIIAGCVLALLTENKLCAMVALAMVGFGVGVVYVFFSAPDLAMTQVLVETLATILFALVLYILPPIRQLQTAGMRVVNTMVAGAFGLIMMIMAWTAYQEQISAPISDYFAKASYTEAHGRNIVNVILVDFRGWDTFGEILVIAIASIGVITLLSGKGWRKI